MPAPDTCPSCGARLPDGAERCPLCGTPVASTGDAADDEQTEAAGEENAAAGVSGAGAFCNECGWKNPPGANFCSRCGRPLQDVSQSRSANPMLPPGTKPAGGPPPPPEDPRDEDARDAPPPSASERDDGGVLSRRVALVTGVAVLVVAGLFLLSSWSAGGDEEAPGPPSEASAARSSSGAPAAMAPGGAAAPSTDGDATRRALPDEVRAWADADLPSSIDEDADSLAATLENQSGTAQQETRRQQVNLFIGGGRPDRAARAQWTLARATGATEDWRRAGNLLMRWAGNAERTQRPRLAALATDAFQRVLKDTPDDPDVRLSLASAFISTNNPMRGISEIKSILKDHPDHLRTRMAYGMMQLQIGRRKAALQQFERVRKSADEDSRVYRQAEQAVQEIHRQSDGAPTDAPLPSGNAPSGNAPSGNAPSGNAPSGNAPSGNAPFAGGSSAPSAQPPSGTQ